MNGYSGEFCLQFPARLHESMLIAGADKQVMTRSGEFFGYRPPKPF
jgi:hypothetical protein